MKTSNNSNDNTQFAAFPELFEQEIKRRDFLKRTAGFAGGLAVLGAEPAIAQTGQTSPPSERVRYALVGCGGMGNAHLDTLLHLKSGGYPVEIVAVCDVYDVRSEAAAKKTGGKAYGDYRKVLERKDIDAIGIATPEHWHSQIAIDAANAGKDVYCEKPLTHWHDLSEPRRVFDAVKRNNRVLQMGTQGMADSIWAEISKRVGDGVIGKLIHAQSSDMRNGPIGVYDPTSNDGAAKPGVNLNWDMWLGSATKRPWEPGRFFAFRSFWDYSGGVGTDFFPHILAPLVRSMNLDFPKRVTAIGGQYAYIGDGREIPDIYNLLIEYPHGPTVYLAGGIANSVNLPTIIRGHKGTVYPHQSPGAVIRPENMVAPDAEEIQITRTRGGTLEEHYRDFLDCVKSRGEPRSNINIALRVMTAINLGVHSFRSGRTLSCDPKTGLELL